MGSAGDDQGADVVGGLVPVGQHLGGVHAQPGELVDALRLAGVLLLTVAMASLGVDTNLGRMGQAGVKPLLLGAGLFVHLVLVGGVVNWLAA